MQENICGFSFDFLHTKSLLKSDMLSKNLHFYVFFFFYDKHAYFSHSEGAGSSKLHSKLHYFCETLSIRTFILINIMENNENNNLGIISLE